MGGCVETGAGGEAAKVGRTDDGTGAAASWTG